MKKQITEVALKDRPQPDDFRGKTGQKILNEQSQVLRMIHNVKNYVVTNNMKMSVPKTKLIVFNLCTSKDCLPLFEVENTILEFGVLSRTHL